MHKGLWILRPIFVLAAGGAGYTMALMLNQHYKAAHDAERLTVPLKSVDPLLMGGFCILLAGIVIFIDFIFTKKSIASVVAIVFGTIVGLVLALLAGQIVRIAPVPLEWSQPLQVIIIVIFCYLGISIVVQTRDDFRFVIPYVQFRREPRGRRPLILDTSVIIDGRVADIMDTGLVDNVLVVPESVLQELQTIADSSDRLKRARGRRGLDMLQKLQTNPRVEVLLHKPTRTKEAQEYDSVDSELIGLAKNIDGRIVTNDFNLVKMATLQGVEAINLNEVANALRQAVLPGEKIQVRLVKPGEEVGQGVGYLPDGTMVVVEHGRDHVDEEVLCSVTSILQTAAGRMIFGRLEREASPPENRSS